MNDIAQGAIAGVIFGIIAALLMLPMTFPDKKSALLGAFLSRFAIGFLIGASTLPVSGWLLGATIGLLVSLPEAIITKSYVPIIIVGILGGALIGFIIR
jgi:hypothetical protein